MLCQVFVPSHGGRGISCILKFLSPTFKHGQFCKNNFFRKNFRTCIIYRKSTIDMPRFITFGPAIAEKHLPTHSDVSCMLKFLSPTLKHHKILKNDFFGKIFKRASSRGSLLLTCHGSLHLAQPLLRNLRPHILMSQVC